MLFWRAMALLTFFFFLGLKTSLVGGEELTDQSLVPPQEEVGSAFSSLSALPGIPNYQAVMARASRLRSLGRQMEWQSLPITGWFWLDHSHPQLSEIRRRLVALGDLSPSKQAGTVFDLSLLKAVMRFQHRHGLKPDGVIGSQTLAWLNTSPEQRADLLINNYRRQALFFRQAQESYLLVNIPQFQLSLVDEGVRRINSRVIVGTRWRQTPELSSRVEKLVVNPAWNVPPGITRRDLLPKIINDNDYLLKHHYEVYDTKGKRIHLDELDWTALSGQAFPYRLRQRPGVHNTLGRYKWYFTNAFHVYLHDTPDKGLFDRFQRTFSSGCVRVERAEELARIIARERVNNQAKWQRAQQSREENHWFDLSESLPVYLVYWTAWIDQQQLTHFRQDIYRRETKSTLREQFLITQPIPKRYQPTVIP